VSLAVLLLSVSPALAGFTVNVEYLDPNGTQVTTTGTGALYAYFRRTLYRKREGPGVEKFRDDELRLDSFPFQGRGIPFQQIREVRFERRQVTGREILFLEFELTTGERLEEKGADLEGAEHPISPVIAFETPSGVTKIPLDPLLSPTGRKGHPSLLRIDFPNTPDRRSPRRR
jgi:hypothetical protein